MSRLEDMETTAKIKVALMVNPRVDGFEIGVDTVNGITFLSGFVQDPEQRDLAEDIARERGALDVKNDVVALSDGDTGPPEGERGSEAGGEAEDRLLRERVIGGLANDSRINSFTMTVEVTGGVARLSGRQPTDEARSRAEQIARGVQGVDEVVNEIDVGGKGDGG